jgi:hypothetical protein
MIKPIVQREVLKGWGVDPDKYFGLYESNVGIQIDPISDPIWINDPSIFKVAVQAEPPSVNNYSVEKYLLNNGRKYNLILSYYESILTNLDNSVLNYFGGTWIKEIKTDFDKFKTVSFITSDKNFAVGHKVRMKIIELLKGKFDLYGRGFNEISNKMIGLENYMFSIVIENEFMKNWFTEKIVDCFMTKTVPIYKGCPNLGDFYEEKGIIKFETIEELDQILTSLNHDKYQSMLESIEKNYQSALIDQPFEKRVENTIKKYATK